MDHDPFAEFEALGEKQVRLKLASLEWQGTQGLKAREWLEFSAWKKRDAREERTLRIAMTANVIATISALIAITSFIIAKF